MNQYKNPTWWTAENDSAWDHVKMAMKRDWDQTKHDMGGNKPDTNQNVGHTVKQATGNETIPPRNVPAYDDFETAHRFGFGARSKYGSTHADWDEELETSLKRDWDEIAPSRKQIWTQDRTAIQYGWNYDARELVKAGKE